MKRKWFLSLAVSLLVVLSLSSLNTINHISTDKGVVINGVGAGTGGDW